MRSLLLAWFAIATAQAQPTISFEKIARYREIVAGQEIEMTIHQREFDFSRCKLTGGEDTGEAARIDGVKVAGTDGRSPARIPGWPRIETIAEIELKWNGKTVEVPKQVHVNLLDLGLGKDGIQIVPRPSGEELLIQAIGGDGGASYIVSLVLRKDGKHKQYECGYCEDGLRPYPYDVEEVIGVDENGNTKIRSFSWLTPKAKQGGAGQPAPAPESKPENKDQPQPESKPAPADHFKEEAEYLGLLSGLQFVETTEDLKKLIPDCPPPQAYAGEDNTEIEVKNKLFGVDAKGEFHFHKGILVSHGFEVLTANYQEAHRVFLEAVAILDQQADGLKLSAALPTALDGADSSDGPRDEISIRVEGTDKNASFGLGLDMRQESTRVRWWAQKVSIPKE